MKNGDQIAQDINQVIHAIAILFFIGLGLFALYFIIFGIVVIYRRIFKHGPTE